MLSLPLEASCVHVYVIVATLVLMYAYACVWTVCMHVYICG